MEYGCKRGTKNTLVPTSLQQRTSHSLLCIVSLFTDVLSKREIANYFIKELNIQPSSYVASALSIDKTTRAL